MAYRLGDGECRRLRMIDESYPCCVLKGDYELMELGFIRIEGRFEMCDGERFYIEEVVGLTDQYYENEAKYFVA